MFSKRQGAAALVAAAVAALAACGSDGAAAGPGGDCPVDAVEVVVSVSQWGDIVRELAGGCGKTTVVISGSSVDPHAYEPTPGDLAAFGAADLVVVNGLDYDPWAVAAAKAGAPDPPVVNAGDVAGRRAGDNPHVWYAPEVVTAVADAVTAELSRVAPQAAGYFDDRASEWRDAMQPYFDEVGALSARVAGNATYAATEPVFASMAEAIGLVDETPPGYARSSANQIDPSPGDLHDFERVLADGGVDVLVVNTQTSGAVPDQLRGIAERSGVPVVEVTEGPPNDRSFVDWQLGQLHALDAVLP